MRADKAYGRSWFAGLRQAALIALFIVALSHAGFAQRIEAGQPGVGQRWSAQTYGSVDPAGVQFATRAGQVELLAGRPDGVGFRLQGNAVPVSDLLDEFNYRSPVFQIGADDVFAIVSRCAGTACTFAGIRFVRLRPNAAPVFSNPETLNGPFWAGTTLDAGLDRVFRQSGSTIVVGNGPNARAGGLVYTNDTLRPRR